MKHLIGILIAVLLSACSALQPYKDQSLDELKNIAHHPEHYYGKIISVSGEVKGTTEDTTRLRLVLKTDVPFYYYATGKGNALSYELILVEYTKPAPAMTGIQKGNDTRVLARVSSYEKRQNLLGMEIGILHLSAFAVADRTQKQDFFHETAPEQQLYESWKKGRLFYEETPEQIIAQYPAPSIAKAPAPTEQPTPGKTISPAARDIVYDEEEEFVLK